MHGTGNDMIVLDLRTMPAPTREQCRALADRHTGVGGDMILGVDVPRNAGSAASYAIWTADGSRSRQCGNGARCVAAWVLRAGLAQGPRFMLDSPSGTHRVETLGAGNYRIELGVPQFAPSALPLQGIGEEQDNYLVDLGVAGTVRCAAVSTGNPHAVIEVDDVALAPLARIGPALQGGGIFPPSVNVGFVQVLSPERIRLRVYEFGAGETLACGSGACAAAAVLMRRGRVGRAITVELPGGELQIAWPDEKAPVTLAGPATFVFEGEYTYGTV